MYGSLFIIRQPYNRKGAEGEKDFVNIRAQILLGGVLLLNSAKADGELARYYIDFFSKRAASNESDGNFIRSELRVILGRDHY